MVDKLCFCRIGPRSIEALSDLDSAEQADNLIASLSRDERLQLVRSKRIALWILVITTVLDVVLLP